MLHMDITKERIMKLVSNAHDMSGLDAILDLNEVEDEEEEVDVDFDEGIISDLDIDEALPLIDNDALFDLIAKTINVNASGDGEYSIKGGIVSFLFQLNETTEDEKYRITPVNKTCKATWKDFITMVNSIVQDINAKQKDTSATSTQFKLAFKRKEE